MDIGSMGNFNNEFLMDSENEKECNTISSEESINEYDELDYFILDSSEKKATHVRHEFILLFISVILHELI